ncbi:hypothetical protein KTQ03_11215 [Klebsiella michiganensis]|uniref:hypothetical protein n=1 Tax=Klebsiella michiganensis TaxID=1134687 RepID=UPI001C2C2CA4|nr:hypothetical protein [Klebsiella michiganensis]MBU9997981.1 hypothetical protein [Klebsiella michiganensis]
MEESEQEKRERELMEILWKKFRSLSPELFSEFLAKRGVPIVSCPICGGTDMAIPQASEQIYDGDKPTAEWLTYVNPSKESSFGFEPLHSLIHYNYRIICKNCGHENRFSAYPVLTWLEKNNKQKDDM